MTTKKALPFSTSIPAPRERVPAFEDDMQRLWPVALQRLTAAGER